MNGMEIATPLTGILLGLAVLLLSLALAAWIVPGIHCDGPVGLIVAVVLYEAVSLIFGLVATALMETIPIPAAAAELGALAIAVGFLVGAVILWFVGQVVPGYRVSGFGSALFGAAIIWAAQFALSAVVSLPALREVASAGITS